MIVNVVLAILAWVLAVRIVRRLPDLWHNFRGYDADVAPAVWPLGLPTWRAMNRAQPAAALFFCFLALLFTLFLFGDDPVSIPGLKVVAIPVYVGGLITMIGGVFIGACARPKWALVPHLRHQPSLFAEWLGATPTPTPRPVIQTGVGPTSRSTHRNAAPTGDPAEGPATSPGVDDD